MVNNVPKVPALTWITNFGLDAETKGTDHPERCKARFGWLLSKLQNYPVDGYISLVRDLSAARSKLVSVYTNFTTRAPRAPAARRCFSADDSGPVSPIICGADHRCAAAVPEPAGTLFIESCIGREPDCRGFGVSTRASDFTGDPVAGSTRSRSTTSAAQRSARIYAAEIIERGCRPRYPKLRAGGLT